MLIRLRAERLTATLKSDMWRHTLACASAVSMTHHVSWSIKPALSATGMNSVGEMGPNWSWLQRSSRASQLTTAPVLSSTTGWVPDVEVGLLDGLAQLGGQPQPAQRRSVLDPVVEPDAAPRPLGGVHSDVGMAQQSHCVMAVGRGDGDTQAGPYVEQEALDA